MNLETQRELLRRFFALRAAHTTTLAAAPYRQRASVYTDPARLALEETTLFRRRALIAALSADLPGTGDCLATEVAGVPLLLVRGEDAEVRAFLNICRHRGGRVFTGRGRPGRALKCPYHSWAYDLNGDLLGQPSARDAFEPLERDELGLRSVPVAFGSIVYILFPTTVINLPMSGHAEFWEMYPEPGNPHRTRVSVRFYVPRAPDSDEDRTFWDANVRFTHRVVFEEDFGQQQDIHRSLRTGLMPEVVYGRNEPALIHFHSEVEVAVGADAGATPLRSPLG